MSIKPPVSLTAASLAALFALTACSSSDTSDSSGGSSEGAADSGPSVVEFDFSETTAGPASSIEFRIPDEILEQEDNYRENRYFESVTLSAADGGESSECAIKYEFEYAEGGLDRLIEDAREYVAIENNEVDRGMAHALVDKNLDSIELDPNYDYAVVPVDCAMSPDDDDDTVMVAHRWEVESTFAWAKVSVMKDSGLFVQDVWVRRWETDSNGSWIKG
ncbi:hypothetical protein ACFW3Z_03625 [Nocardiopsis alba]|uniref:hypothetical protein n=1 Tax=Nocardiopsis alba TaxID=53437 RepID=UPI0033EFF966